MYTISKEQLTKMGYETHRTFMNTIGDYSIKKWCELSDDERDAEIRVVTTFLDSRQELERPITTSSISNHIYVGLIFGLYEMIEV